MKKSKSKDLAQIATETANSLAKQDITSMVILASDNRISWSHTMEKEKLVFIFEFIKSKLFADAGDKVN